MSRARSKGRAWEAKCRDWLQSHAFPTRRYEGIGDPRGDLDIQGVPCVIECKDHAGKLDWSAWSQQADASSDAKGCPGYWAIIAHRLGRAGPDFAYFMVSRDFFLHALQLMQREQQHRTDWEKPIPMEKTLSEQDLFRVDL